MSYVITYAHDSMKDAGTLYLSLYIYIYIFIYIYIYTLYPLPP
jgi:hypothetical protein